MVAEEVLQKRFEGKRTLLVTGERAEESAGRAKYKEFEPHKSNGKKRVVDQWRPVHKWSEERVWVIIQRYGVNPHPAYKLGWGRVSCMTCIFGSKNQWASIQQIAPKKFEDIATYEELFGLTIHRNKSVNELADNGTAYDMDTADVDASQSRTFDEPILLDDWKLPSGAFGESNGPV